MDLKDKVGNVYFLESGSVSRLPEESGTKFSTNFNELACGKDKLDLSEIKIRVQIEGKVNGSKDNKTPLGSEDFQLNFKSSKEEGFGGGDWREDLVKPHEELVETESAEEKKTDSSREADTDLRSTVTPQKITVKEDRDSGDCDKEEVGEASTVEVNDSEASSSSQEASDDEEEEVAQEINNHFRKMNNDLDT